MPQAGPLTDTDYRSLTLGLGKIATTREHVMRAQESGLDMSELLATLDALEYQLLSIKKSFFPDRP